MPPYNHSFKSEWVVAHVVRSNGPGPCIRIMKSNHRPYPRYSFQFGNTKRDGTVVDHFNPHLSNQQIIEPRPDSTFINMHEVLRQAELWIMIDATYEANRVVEERAERDVKAANYGKTVTRVTGKTAKRRLAKLGGNAEENK